MLYILETKHIHLFNLQSHPLLRCFIAMLTAFLITIVVIPTFIRFVRLRNITSTPKGLSSLPLDSKFGIPIMGGVPLLFGSTISILLWCDVTYFQVPLVLSFTMAFATIGFLDDIIKTRSNTKSLGLSQNQKLLAQLFLGILLGLIVTRSEFTDGRKMITTLTLPFLPNFKCDLKTNYIFFAAIYITFVSNAVNITDGLDGLVTIPVVLSSIVLSIFAYVVSSPSYANFSKMTHLPGSFELAILLTAVIGSAIAFLWYNASPASIFLGDTGSLALGALLGTSAILVKQEILLLLAGGLFTVEALSSIIQSYLGVGFMGRRLFLRAPLHHASILKGIGETKTVVRFWLIAFLFAALAILSLEYTQ